MYYITDKRHPSTLPRLTTNHSLEFLPANCFFYFTREMESFTFSRQDYYEDRLYFHNALSCGCAFDFVAIIYFSHFSHKTIYFQKTTPLNHGPEKQFTNSYMPRPGVFNCLCLWSYISTCHNSQQNFRSHNLSLDTSPGPGKDQAKVQTWS